MMANEFRSWPMDAQLAYIAGLFDGEGSIGAKRRMPSAANRRRSPRYSVAVSISMTDRKPIQIVADFCGKSHLVVERKRALHYKTIYQFDLEHGPATEFLSKISPFLVCKRDRALLTMRLATLRADSRNHLTKELGRHTFVAGRAKGHEHVVWGLSDQYLADCEAVYQALRVGSPRSGQPGSWGNRN